MAGVEEVFRGIATTTLVPLTRLTSCAIGMEAITGGGAGGGTFSTETAATIVGPLAVVEGDAIGGADAVKGGGTPLDGTKLGTKLKLNGSGAFGVGAMGIGASGPGPVASVAPLEAWVTIGPVAKLGPGTGPNPKGPPPGLLTTISGGKTPKGGGPEGFVGGGGGAVVVNT